MKKYYRCISFFLCLLMAFLSIDLRVYAESLNQYETEETVLETEEVPTVEETVLETEEVPTAEETVLETEEVPTAEETVLETEEVPTAEETVLETEEVYEAEETVLETEEVFEAEESEIMYISSFQELSESDKYLTLDSSYKPSQDQISDYLPESLEVCLDGSDEIIRIPVEWRGPDDYEDSSYYYYAFFPVWDENAYMLKDGVQIPYVWVQFESALLNAGNVSGDKDEETIYEYLTSVMGLNMAGACGVLANIEAECEFDPGLVELTSSHDKGYGLFQWTFDRRSALEKYLKKHKYAMNSVIGQMEYFHYELKTNYKGVLKKLREVTNNSQGAYDAAYYLCYHYEIPADTEANSIARGYRASTVFFLEYAGGKKINKGAANLSGQTYPETIEEGGSFQIKGIISSPSKIISVTVGVFDAADNQIIGKTVKPGEPSYDLKNIQKYISFENLDGGVYKYRIRAVNAAGTNELFESPFTVLSKERTVKDGVYYISSLINGGYVLSVKNNSKASGKPLLLRAVNKNANYDKFRIEYQSNGFYKLLCIGSDLLMTVAYQSPVPGTEITQSYAGTLWQILPDGSGAYALVPECADDCILGMKGTECAENTVIQSSNPSLNSNQRWILQPTEPLVSEEAPVILSASKPGPFRAGKSFTAKGVIKSDSLLKEVTAGIYNASGEMLYGTTLKPEEKVLDLKRFASYLKFSSLTPGVYRYRVTAVNEYKEKILINKAFTVLANLKTVDDGSFYLVISKNTDYALRVKSNSRKAGAGIELGRLNRKNKFSRFKLIYQKNSFYKIRNIGSGLYLTVRSQSSAKNTKITQTKSGTFWQILPDSRGGCSLVPYCAQDLVVGMRGSKVKSGKGIVTCKADLGLAQSFKLVTTEVLRKPAISKQNYPVKLKAGQKFTIKGIIKSDTRISRLTFGVYDSANKLITGRSASPYKFECDLSKVNSFISFQSLKPGKYTYKVTAKNEAGKKTLIKKTFTVK